MIDVFGEVSLGPRLKFGGYKMVDVLGWLFLVLGTKALATNNFSQTVPQRLPSEFATNIYHLVTRCFNSWVKANALSHLSSLQLDRRLKFGGYKMIDA